MRLTQHNYVPLKVFCIIEQLLVNMRFLKPLIVATLLLHFVHANADPGYIWSSDSYTIPSDTEITSSDAPGIVASGTSLGTLLNSGVVSSTSISPAYDGIYINPNTQIEALVNTSNGQIFGSSAGSAILIADNVRINNLTNYGVIGSASNNYAIAIGDMSTIGTLTNWGTIKTGVYDGIFVWSTSEITTLNNAQGAGNLSGPLVIEYKLPTNYNVILGATPSIYGKLVGLGLLDTTLSNFGIYSGNIQSKIYSGVLSGITDVTNGKTGTYSGQIYQLVLEAGSSDTWDLLFPNWSLGPNAANTLQSVQQMAAGFSSIYNQQASAYQAALSYDCRVYDEAGLCVSVGGRYTYAGPSPSSNQQAGLVIVGYKPVQTFRVGAFADQSVNVSTPSGFSQSKSSPMWGLFAKWHMNKDETGLGVQASAVTSSSSLTVTRPQLFNTEAGSGTTQFNGQGYQLTTNYHQPVTDSTALVPYLGLRYTRINAGAYTENTTATVTSPLSYNAMAQSTFSAIGGIGVRSHLAEKLTGTASVGIQQNLNYSMGNYAGTSSIMGLESFSVKMPGNVNSMATATAGLFYDINKRERVGVNVLWQQQPFIATNTTTALATYTIGF